jgi:hypothetical protein
MIQKTTRSDLAAEQKLIRLYHAIESRIDFFARWLRITYSDNNDELDVPSIYSDKFQDFTTKANKLLNSLHSAGKYYSLSKTVDKGKFSNFHRAEMLYLRVLRIVNSWGERYEHFSNIFFPIVKKHYEATGLLKRVQQQFAESNQVSTYNRLAFLARSQFQEAFDKNKYIVFSLLTIDDENWDYFWDIRNGCWKNYTRRLKRFVQQDCYGSYRNADENNETCFEYIAVVELGENTDREHIHMISFWDSDCDWCDPNQGSRNPENREIFELERFWPWGNSNNIAVRFSPSDPYGQAGWIWPVEEGQPIPSSEVDALVNYLINYMMKEKPYEREKTWRVRKSHGLGMKPLLSSMESLTLDEMMSLATMKTSSMMKIKMWNQHIPIKLLRKVALKTLKKHLTLNQMMTMSLPKNESFKNLCNLLNEKTSMYSPENAIGAILELSNREDISNETMPFIKSAKHKLEKYAPSTLFDQSSAGATHSSL